MEIAAIILAVIAAFVVLKFISGMVKFVVLGVVVLALFYFMTGGFGA
jgi:hypothetical protein